MTDASAQPSLDYLAGYFDGEGCVSIVKYRDGRRQGIVQHVLHVGVTGTDPTILLEFRRQLGGHIRKQARRAMNHRPLFYWNACSNIGAQALRTLLPRLIIKRHDAEIGVAFQELVGTRRRGKAVPPAVTEAREGLRLRLVAKHGFASRARDAAAVQQTATATQGE